ncbi:class I SAM-dependent methyltransferase [Mycolicibacterium sp. P9-64]|uniref:class I SAM-dependent methyltransferase n=1 Tax=Mycolicibacterium sp. P9-64 TaxID=2024612 RepID=UPI0011ED2BB5|nr:class I SAM-dependent methyltransferase [Mycolicibacterium sp. P9-64]KAA0080696.1 class I SAM-dependent methyltransferase [Mycolicibacterium sp. P9-64]
MSSEPKVDGTTLTGVSETALLTLKVRASEARRPDAIIDDPMAIELVDAIDFDFAKFGYSRRQDMALRALAFDDATRTYLLDHPAATVVALAEGLQTSFYRLAAGGAGNQGEASDVGEQFRWLTVDLPPIVELRTKLLPASDRLTVCAQSALDYSWMDQVDSSRGVFITAEGLLMYLQPAESMGLIAECARRFPGGRMMFDLPPSWFAMWARRGLRTSLRYRVPPMPFAMSAAEAATLVDVVPGIRAVHDVPLPRGRGKVLNTTMWAIQRIPLLDPVRPALTLLEFG